MLQLTRIHIKNFRSFRDAYFELKDLQLLIGPNNSGKTNLLRVFEFLRMVNDVELHGNQILLNGKSEIPELDIEKIRFQHKESHGKPGRLPDPVEITIEFYDSVQKSHLYYKLELFYLGINSAIYNHFIGLAERRLSADKFSHFDLENFQDRLNDFSNANLIRNRTMNAGDDNLLPKDLVVNPQNNWNYTISLIDKKISFSQGGHENSLNILLKGYYYGANEDFMKTTRQIAVFLSKLIIYKPDTFYIKTSNSIQPDVSITANCSNIVSYLENLIISNQSQYQKVIKDLKKCIPDFEEYNFSTIEVKDNGSGKQYQRVLRLRDKSGVSHLAEDISEGTLYFLMLIAIINQTDIPPILMLEEPETGIHPRRISEIMEFIMILREEHPEISIILTTHHPYVVDHFSEMTDRVWIFDTKDGESVIKNLEHDVIEPNNEKIKNAGMEPINYTASLGEHWALGFLGGVPKPVVR